MKKLLFLFLLFLSKGNFAQIISDIIPPLNLTSGETDTLIISDLFYADNYNLDFSSPENFTVEYLKNEQLLLITPDIDFTGAALINFVFKEKNFAIPVKSTQRNNYTFSYTPSDNPGKIFLIGTFNGWDRSRHQMKDDDGDGTFEISIPLDEGLYEYKFFIDSVEIADPLNNNIKPNGMGGYNSLLEISSEKKSKNYLHILEKILTNKGYKISFYYENENPVHALTKDKIIALAGNEPINQNNINISGNLIELFISEENYDLPFKETIIRVMINDDGVVSNIQNVYLDYEDKPNNMIIFSLMIDRFYDGNSENSKRVDHPELKAKANYLGGDFEGIIKKIKEGYFTSLGVNTLWLSPIIENTNSAYREYPAPHRYYSAYHGYWPVSTENVEERFGDINLLLELIEEAEKKGIRILLDFVSHHVHIEHPFWVEHPDWFGKLDLPDGRKNLRLWDEHRLTTWFEPYLPSFDFINSPEALETMTDNALWWIQKTGVAGFRHDAVKHVPNIFWRSLTKKIKEKIEIPLNKKIFQIGETFGSYELISSYVNNGQLDAQFNFNLYDIALPVFLTDTLSFTLLNAELKKTFEVYGVNNLMGNIMDSHDKVRFMAYADGDISFGDPDAAEIGWTKPPEVDKPSSYEKLKLYLAYLLTIPGIPVIYYGDEIGMSGAADPDNRRMMRFDENLNSFEKNTLNEVSRIVNLRNENSALKFGDFYPVFVDDNSYAFIRSDGKQRILIALNKNESPEKINIFLPDFYKTEAAENLLTGEKYSIKNKKVTVDLPSFGYKIFRLN